MKKRHKFNLGNIQELTMDMGYLIPVVYYDVMPGDRFFGGTRSFIRLAPMIKPIMHPIDVKIHHWFVPYRLIWEDFEEFFLKNEEPPFPVIEFDKNEVGNLADYMGCPLFYTNETKPEDWDLDKYTGYTLSANPLELSALPFRAYNLIWNNFYRDQDLQPEIPVSVENGIDNVTPVNLQKIAWSKDYFTIARPWEQQGEEVQIPVYSPIVQNPRYFTSLITLIPGVVIEAQEALAYLDSGIVGSAGSGANGDKVQQIFSNSTVAERMQKVAESRFSGDNIAYAPFSIDVSDIKQDLGWRFDTLNFYCGVEYKDGNSSGFQDWTLKGSGYTVNYEYFSNTIQEAGVVNITDVRLGIAQQRIKERKARYGSQYRDYLASLGVKYSDARLQLPEYLGGGRSILQISEVIQSAPAESLPLGNLGGHGIGIAKSNRFIRTFPEHGIVFTLMYVQPRSLYANGLERYLLKRTPDDFYQHEIAQLVLSQEIYKQELYAFSTENDIFGYIDRYDEYRYKQSSVKGMFRTTETDWHMARIFDSPPALNGTFIQCNPTKRIFAEQTTHALYVMCVNQMRARRILPKQGKTGAL